MTTFLRPPKLLQPFFSKPLLAGIIAVAAFHGCVTAANIHNQKVYQRQRIFEEERQATLVEQEVKEKIIFSKQVVACRPVCNKPPIIRESPRVGFVRKPVKVAVRSNTVHLASLSPEERRKNPNTIRISLAEAPTIASKVKMVNGKGICPKKSDKPHRSGQNKKGHVDRQCCLDPDEIPNPRCAY